MSKTGTVTLPFSFGVWYRLKLLIGFDVNAGMYLLILTKVLSQAGDLL